MKTIIKMLFAAVLISGSVLGAQAQESSQNLLVSAQLKEINGNYDQRKLYREFLTDYMQDCPFISHFSIHEVPGSSDNHEVIWNYQVSNWNDITQFYNWINDHLKSKDDGLKKALTPYQPAYAVGGNIRVEKMSKTELAKEKSTNKSDKNNG